MKHVKIPLILAVVTALSTLTLHAQHKRLSPHETVSSVIDGNRVTIVYGRPYTVKPGTTEARQIWGGLVPYGKPWRMGADEATLLVTQKPLEINGTTVSAGAYTLYMLPEENGTSKLAIGTRIGQWGVPVDTSHDLARVNLEKKDLDEAVNQFTIAIDRNASSGGVLKFKWEKAEYSVAFTVGK